MSRSNQDRLRKGRNTRSSNNGSYRRGGSTRRMPHGGYHGPGQMQTSSTVSRQRTAVRNRVAPVRPVRQVNQSVVSNQTNITFSFKAPNEDSLISQMATSFDVDEMTIRNKVEPYLQDIMSVGGDSSNVPMEWWNCSRCGSGGGLCLFGNCCNGSAGGGEWEIDCTRPIGKPKRPN